MHPRDMADAMSAVGEPFVSVIIPTMASAARADLLHRAVQSIRSSSARPVQIIAVVNGNRFDAEVCAWLKNQPDIHCDFVDQPSAPNAVLRGRELVKTAFFSTLDDDDEYLPGSTDQKLALLQSNPRVDVVIGNYYHHTALKESLRYRGLSDVAGRPLEALMDFNWLSSGNALFRSESISVNYFQGSPPYGEWTFVAFRIGLARKHVAVLESAVSRVYGDTADSLSKSATYFDAYIPLFRQMLRLAPPPHIVRMIQRKMSAAHHDASVAALKKGERMEAFAHHWQSLVRSGGLRYLSYTRHLMR